MIVRANAGVGSSGGAAPASDTLSDDRGDWVRPADKHADDFRGLCRRRSPRPALQRGGRGQPAPGRERGGEAGTSPHGRTRLAQNNEAGMPPVRSARKISAAGPARHTWRVTIVMYVATAHFRDGCGHAGFRAEAAV
jgi:hypothetical protein